MELNKKKYKKAEVSEIISAISKDYQSELKYKSDAFDVLSSEYKNLFSKYEALKSEMEDREKEMQSLAEKHKQINKEISAEYRAETEKIKAFSTKFSDYVDSLTEKYPYYKEIENFNKVYKEIKTLFSDKKSDKEIVKKTSELISDKKNNREIFDPQRKINEYIAATGDNGFNLDEVLNPGELKLEDICKELGLIEEK